MTKTLQGPRIEPRGRPASSLVVLLHGYGANGDDLIALADGWQGRLPETAFVAPNAPGAIPGMYGGLQWFALTMRDPGEYWRGVEAARPALDGFLDAELARYGLGPDRLALVGFSQGSMMALHVGLRRAAGPAGIVAYSGLLAGPEHLATASARPPVLLIHGEADDLIPVEALHMAREPLAKAGFAVEWHVRAGLGHGIDPGGQAMAGHFLRQVLQASSSRKVPDSLGQASAPGMQAQCSAPLGSASRPAASARTSGSCHNRECGVLAGPRADGRLAGDLLHKDDPQRNDKRRHDGRYEHRPGCYVG